MLHLLLVAAGGATGSVMRYLVGQWSIRLLGPSFPWGTLIVNVLGSFVIGFFATLTSPAGRMLVSSGGRQFFMTGVLGGFTTFSSFSLQTLNLARDGEWWQAGGNVAASVGACLVAVWLGHLAAVTLNSLKGS